MSAVESNLELLEKGCVSGIAIPAAIPRAPIWINYVSVINLICASGVKNQLK